MCRITCESAGTFSGDATVQFYESCSSAPKNIGGGPRVENTHRACFCVESIHKTGRWMCTLQSAGMCCDAPKSVYEDPMDAVL